MSRAEVWSILGLMRGLRAVDGGYIPVGKW